MAVFSTKIELKTEGRDDVHDITGEIEAAVSDSRIRSGLVNVFVVGSTASVTTMEFEPGLVKDIKVLGERVAPAGVEWSHNAAWGDGNGHSHLKASLIGPSLTVPFVKGKLALGVWQQIVLIDHDIRSRKREIMVQVIGD